MIFAPITNQRVQMLQKKFYMLYCKFDNSNNNACVYIVLFLDNYTCNENASYLYYSMFRQKLISGKSFMCRNLVELFVEFKFINACLPCLFCISYYMCRLNLKKLQHCTQHIQLLQKNFELQIWCKLFWINTSSLVHAQFWIIFMARCFIVFT